jgi:DNA-binding helix-hairpin-helix protein with protein kinase domain
MTFPPSPIVDSKGRLIPLGPELGRGGEGAVFEVRDRPDLVAKIYMRRPDRDHAAKLAAMASSGDERTLKLAAWPTGTVHERSGQTLGFLMPKVAGFRPAFELYGPKLRLQKFPKADWRFLIRAAANTARAFNVVHAAGHVIGDVNHGNLVVGQDATVRLIDCDSFQISAGSKTWFCAVGVPTHQPPEMQGMASYSGFVRTSNHDNFGLAVLIFQLLCLARHPYSGRFLGAGEPPSIEDAIKGFHYAYCADTRATQMGTPPGSLSMGAVTPQVRQMFEGAFLRGGARNNGRPTPGQWISALDDLSAKLRQCTASPSHHYLNSLTACPWCEIEGKSSALLFPAVFVAGASGADGFLILWQQVLATPVPRARDKLPDPPGAKPSPEARRRGKLLRITCLLEAIAACGGYEAISLGVNPAWQATFMVWLSIIVATTTLMISVATGREIKRRTRGSRKQWTALNQEWTAGPKPDPAALRADLEQLKRSYDALQADRNSKLQKLHENRRNSQMVEYLDSFQIAGAKVRGVGQSKAAILQSYGIETAADVSSGRILAISGFGPKTVQNLLDWRHGLEQRFKFNPAKGVPQSEIAIVENGITVQRRALEQKLSAGLGTLRLAIQKEVSSREALLTRYQQIAPAYGQAEADSKAASVFG